MVTGRPQFLTSLSVDCLIVLKTWQQVIRDRDRDTETDRHRETLKMEAMVFL